MCATIAVLPTLWLIDTTTTGAQAPPLSAEEFEQRYSPCPEPAELSPLSAFGSVTAWSRIEALNGVDLLDEFGSVALEVESVDITGGAEADSANVRLGAHDSFVEGLKYGLAIPDSTVIVALYGVGPEPTVFAAFILLSDGRVLAPGQCVMRSFGLGSDVTEETRAANTELIRSLFGLVGEDLDRVIASVTEPEQPAGNSAPPQVFPGNNDEALLAAGVPLVEVVVNWPDDWIADDGIVCFESAFGWGMCVSTASPATGDAHGVYIDPANPWLRVWRSRSAADLTVEAQLVAETSDALPADVMTLVVVNLTESPASLDITGAVSECQRSETGPRCEDSSDEGNLILDTTYSYTVRDGDSLNAIAERFQMSIEELCTTNDWVDCPPRRLDSQSQNSGS